MADLTIRSAQRSEFDQVAELTIAGFHELGQPGAARRALMHDTPGRAASGDLLVAVDEASGTLVGTASLLRAGTPYARVALPAEAEVRLLAVLPAWRGQGIAAALMTASIARSREWGVEALVLDTVPGNETAQRLYHRLGFVRVPERETEVVPGLGTLRVFTLDLHPA